MKLLAFDTATTACSVALWIDGRIATHRRELLERGHAERLFPMIAEVLAEGGATYAALDALSVTVGPGSFTGVRVGLAAARGIAMAADLPTVGVSTLEALAMAVTGDEARGHGILAALDARRDQVYAQFFDEDRQAVTPPAAMSTSEAAAMSFGEVRDARPIVLVGSGSPLLFPFMLAAGHEVSLSQAPIFPDAKEVAALAAAKGFAAISRRSLSPLYLRDPGAFPPKAPTVQAQA